MLGAAARIAWGFRSLLNGPDATAVVRAVTGNEVHWRAVLEYNVTGHLQAVLDEYLHALKDWRGFLIDASEDLLSDLAETVVNALSLRTVNYATDIPRLKDGGVAVDRHTMRGRFAIRFGDQAIEGEKRQQRAEQASVAFNSPFWPFVLTTTSIGQEGLDFHLYSHAYWVFHPGRAPARIERYVLVLPLSRDASKLEQLRKAVATYRLSFGQPRQEELIEYLAGRIPTGSWPPSSTASRSTSRPNEGSAVVCCLRRCSALRSVSSATRFTNPGSERTTRQ